MRVPIASSLNIFLNSSCVTPINSATAGNFFAIAVNALFRRVPEEDASRPIAIREAPIAAASVAPKPKSFAAGPRVSKKSAICSSDAAVVFPSEFIALPKLLACSIPSP